MYTVYVPILQANVEFISKTVNEMSPSALLAIKVLKNIRQTGHGMWNMEQVNGNGNMEWVNGNGKQEIGELEHGIGELEYGIGELEYVNGMEVGMGDWEQGCEWEQVNGNRSKEQVNGDRKQMNRNGNR